MTYIVPMSWTMNGTAEVEAESQDEAAQLAEDGDFERVTLNEAGAELVDWEVIGKARREDH